MAAVRKTPLNLGVHTSIAGGLVRAVERAESLGCNGFQIFSRNPRGWQPRPLSRQEAHEFRKSREKAGLWPLAVHALYLINLAAADPFILHRSREAFREEIRRSVALGADYLVVHPGSSIGASSEWGIRTAIESVRLAARGMKLTGAGRTGRNRELSILIENTAGQGSSIGCSFEQVADIIAGLDGLPIGVCLDTAHTFASGYDISSETGLKATTRAIHRSFGFDLIKLIHCNDSKVPLGARVDRHQHIGLGHIGSAAFRSITHTARFRRIPFILETPIDEHGDDERNLSYVRELGG
jgi:deoxyribonuclease-4